MKIDEYYRNVARISLNGSIAALIPAIVIIGGNFAFFQTQQIMLLVIPFLLYSIINFQLYLRRVKQALIIGKNLIDSKHVTHSIFASDHLLLLFYNTLSPSLMIFTPDGYLAGAIKKYRVKSRSLGSSSITFALYDGNEELVCFYVVHGKSQLKIEVYDKDKEYIGCFENKKLGHIRKSKKELLNSEGRFIAAVEGAAFYMDEQVVDSNELQVARLRRGWMPLEWSSYFPEPNTPVLSLANGLSDKDRLLQMSFLINEFFIER
jgi:hypothetical protein